MRVWRCGGGASIGRQSAGWETFWNIRAARPIEPPPKGWGAPSMNFLDIRSVGGRITCGEAVIGTAAPVPGAVRLGIRPEHVGLVAAGSGEMGGTVVLRETLGGDAYLYVRTAAGQVVVRADGDTALDHGDTVGLSMPANRLHLFGADGVTLSSGGVTV